MTSTATTPTRSRLPRLGTQSVPIMRHPSRMIGGALAAVLFAMAASATYTQIGKRESVLVLSHPIEQGHVITGADLRTANVAVDGNVKTVPVERQASIIGQVATTRLLEGSLVTPDAVAKSTPLGPERSTIGAALKTGQFPATMRPGDVVLLVAPPANNSMTSGELVAEPGPIKATVATVAPSGDNSGVTAASFVVATSDVSAVAAAGAASTLVAVVQGK